MILRGHFCALYIFFKDWQLSTKNNLGVSGGYQGGYQGYGYQDPGYVTRKELVKSGLLLGAGILKGALLTTAINAINNNNNNGK